MVFGQVYDHPLTCSKEEARCCWTIDDRIRVTSEPHFEDYVREMYQIRQERGDYNEDQQDIDDSGYWSSDDLLVKESEEVTDSYFYDHLYDKNDRKSPPKEHLPTSYYDLKSPPKDVQYVDDQVESPSGFCQGTQADGDLFDDAQVSPTTFSPVQECTDTGICFGPNCVERCFIHNIFSSMDDKKCSHTWTTIDLSRTGQYVSFPYSFFHRGYFKMNSNMIVVTAQLFASDNGSSPNHPSRHLALKNSMNSVNNGMLTIDLTILQDCVKMCS